jgi:hypothetical protein
MSKSPSQAVLAIRAVGNGDAAVNTCQATTKQVADVLNVSVAVARGLLQRSAKKGEISRLEAEHRTARRGEQRQHLSWFQVWECSYQDAASESAPIHVVELNAFERGYLEAALWASSEDNGESLEAHYSEEHLAPDVLQEMRSDCARFIALNAEELQELAPDMAGALFWFSRNDEVTGFWSEEGLSPKAAESLDKSAEDFGPVVLYIGDDGLIHS